MPGQVEALAAGDMGLGVRTCRLPCRAGEGCVGGRQVVEPELSHAVKRPVLHIDGERYRILSQPWESLGQSPVLAQPPGEEVRLEKIWSALQVDNHALHHSPTRHRPASAV